MRRRAAPARAYPSGGLLYWHPEKGFGFVTRDDGEGDAFVHVSALTDPGLQRLEPGERVRLRMGVSSRTGRPAAIEVTVLPPERRVVAEGSW